MRSKTFKGLITSTEGLTPIQLFAVPYWIMSKKQTAKHQLTEAFVLFTDARKKVRFMSSLKPGDSLSAI